MAGSLATRAADYDSDAGLRSGGARGRWGARDDTDTESRGRPTAAMVQIQIHYEGELRCAATHGPSGTGLHTDAPVDNQGRGESFSPTDLLATALGACMATIMGIRARDLGVDLEGARIEVTKHMVADPLRRVGRLAVRMDLPDAPTEARATLERAAHECPVARSVHPALEVEVDFGWGRLAAG
jgi:putative redox protein